MLRILGNRYRHCDGISRRNFLQVGGLAMGGLALPQLLAAQAQAGTSSSAQKGIIMIFLPGGPPHQDMWDLKMDAPSEIRGEFRPIETNVPGIEICELFPKLAQMADKLAFIRSVVGASGRHEAFQCLTGHPSTAQSPQGGWPSLGSTVSKLQGPAHPSVPAFVGLSPRMGHMPWADAGSPGFLGAGYAPFKPNAECKDDMVLNGISLDRLQNRKQMLSALDNFRREADASGMMDGMDSFTQQAFGVLTDSKLLEALDIEREDPAIRARYGKGDPNNRADGGPKLMEQFLMARRLIESGVRCVTLAFSRWDWHGGNFKRGREDMPMLDQGVSALLTDIYERGLDRDVTVIVWGEFGRTPKINTKAGRDHWPQVSCALMAGGGMNTGQVIGSTNRLGEHAQDRPVHFQEIFATLYHNMGIDTERTTLVDRAGRPQYLLDNRYKPLPELV